MKYVGTFNMFIFQKLKTHGTFTLDLQKVLNYVDNVPANIIAEGQEFTPNEWEEVFLSEYKNVTFAE